MHHPLSAVRRGGLLTLGLVLVMALGACSGGAGGSGDDSSGGGTVAVVNGVVEITADDLEFDAGVIQAPAGEAFTIRLTNLEGVPHNLSVYTEEGGETIVEGEIITGPDATTEIQVPALEPGEYYFHCDVHPMMNGSIVVEG